MWHIGFLLEKSSLSDKLMKLYAFVTSSFSQMGKNIRTLSFISSYTDSFDWVFSFVAKSINDYCSIFFQVATFIIECRKIPMLIYIFFNS